MKADERAMLVLIADERPKATEERPFATDFVCSRLPIHPKRVAGLLRKWSDKGWWNYGVSLRTGWLEPKGIEAANQERARVSSVAEHPAGNGGKDGAFDSPHGLLKSEAQG